MSGLSLPLRSVSQIDLQMWLPLATEAAKTVVSNGHKWEYIQQLRQEHT